MTDRELINAARAASKQAYAPYSRFCVGAALECAEGEVVTGCNVENASFGLTVCAERNALFAAVARGRRRFARLAIFAESGDYCVPCGACRQVLYEFAPGLEVLCARSDGRYVSYRLADLLPHPFGSERLGERE